MSPPYFRFKHALIQDAAYQSQSQLDRRKAHSSIARVLQSDFTDWVESQPEILARHLALARQYAESIPLWLKAGTRAALHSANQEARMHFGEGLKLLSHLEESPQKIRLEFDLMLGLGAATCAVQGFGSAETVLAYERAMELGEHLDACPQMFRAIWGLWAGASSWAGYDHALELARQLLRIGQKCGDPIQIQQGHFAKGNMLFWRGDFSAAREHLERPLALYRPEEHQAHIAQFGENVRITSGAYLAWTLWFLGYPRRAQNACRQAFELARRLNHPFSLGYAMTFVSVLQCRLRRPRQALAWADKTLALAQNQDFLLWQVGADLIRGWAQVMLGEPSGLIRMQQSTDSVRNVMGGIALIFLNLLIEARLHLGDFAGALEDTEEALRTAEALGDGHIEAELHRFKGRALLGLGGGQETVAECCFLQAVAIGRRQGARILELRAATDLARLWTKGERAPEAHSLLRPLIETFTEGHETLDLQEAASLLSSRPMASPSATP